MLWKGGGGEKSNICLIRDIKKHRYRHDFRVSQIEYIRFEICTYISQTKK